MMHSGSDWWQFNVLLCMELSLLEQLVSVKLLGRNYTESGERYSCTAMQASVFLPHLSYSQLGSYRIL